MSTRTHRLFLLRAYGDATIALHFLANSPEKNNYTIIASEHLKPLINALSTYIDLSSLQIQFVDFDITKSQLNLFTNRHLISTNTLQQVLKLKRFVKNNPNTGGIDYLEQNNQSGLLNLLLGHPFKAIVNKQVYAEMGEFYKATSSISPSNDIINKNAKEVINLISIGSKRKKLHNYLYRKTRSYSDINIIKLRNRVSEQFTNEGKYFI